MSARFAQIQLSAAMANPFASVSLVGRGQLQFYILIARTKCIITFKLEAASGFHMFCSFQNKLVRSNSSENCGRQRPHTHTKRKLQALNWRSLLICARAIFWLARASSALIEPPSEALGAHFRVFNFPKLEQNDLTSLGIAAGKSLGAR